MELNTTTKRQTKASSKPNSRRPAGGARPRTQNPTPRLNKKRKRRQLPRQHAMDPHRLARLYVQSHASDKNGACTLRYWRGEWWRWEGGRYRKLNADVLKVELSGAIKHIIDLRGLVTKEGTAHQVTTGRIGNVLLALASLLTVDESKEQPIWLGKGVERSFLAFENGLLDLNPLLNGRPVHLEPGSPLWFSPVRLPLDYDPQADAPRWKEFLKEVLENDDKRMAILQEWFGYCLVFDTTQQKFLVLEGDGANGKTVVANTLTNLLGEENVSHVPWESFRNEFDLSSTLGKLANIVAEIGSLRQVDEGLLKAFTGGDSMSFNRKFLPLIHARPSARLTFATNNRPRVSDPSNGLWRRMMLMPFRVTIPEKQRDPFLEAKLKAELPGIFNWAIEGLTRLQQQGQFTVSELVQAAVEDYQSESNPARAFFDECCIEQSDARVPVETLYGEYKTWCANHGVKPLNERQFGKEVVKAFRSIKRIRPQERNHRRYVYEGLKVEVAQVPYVPLASTLEDDLGVKQIGEE